MLLAGIVALGTALRVHAALYPLEPASPDAKVYAQLAASLWQDGTYSAPVVDPSQFSPGPPLLYAAVYSAVGESHRETARLVVAALAVPTILLAYVLGSRVAETVVGRRWARVAGLQTAALMAGWPVFIVFASSFWAEPLAVPLLLAAVIAVLWALRTDTLPRWLVPGVAMGAVAMFRPEYLGVGLLVAVAAGFLVFRRSNTRRGLAAALLVGLGLAVALAPWTARNALVLGRLVPVSTGGGKALYVGTYVPARGIDVTVKRQLLESHPFLRERGARGRVLDAEVRAARTDRLLSRLMARQHPGVPLDEALSMAARENLGRWVREIGRAHV